MPLTAAMTGSRDASKSRVRSVALPIASAPAPKPVMSAPAEKNLGPLPVMTRARQELIGFGIREALDQAVDHIAVDRVRRRVVDGERDDRALALDADDVVENLTHGLCLPRVR